MKLLLVFTMVLTASGCGRKPFWDGDVYVTSSRYLYPYRCSVAGTLTYTEGPVVLDRDGKPVKCRLMTEEEAAQ